jgi:hypothetical protein
MSLTLTIYSDGCGKKKRKGRAFSAEVLAYASASALWDAGSASTLRPAFLLCGTSEEEAEPVRENLRAGERAHMKGDPGPDAGTYVEFMRSAGYAFASERTEEGTIITAHLPELCDFQPGLVDPAGVRFVLFPARDDLAEMHVGELEFAALRRALARLGVAVPHDDLSDLAATAAMWAAYLDERSELPIPPDTSFRIELCLAALKDGLASLAVPPGKTGTFGPFEHEKFGFTAYIAPHVALAPGIACMATHAELAALLAREIKRFDASSRAAPRSTTQARRSNAHARHHEGEH